MRLPTWQEHLPRHENGLRLCVLDLDVIDGTPVLDIKPVMREFLPRGEVRKPGCSRELTMSYWSRGP